MKLTVTPADYTTVTYGLVLVNPHPAMRAELVRWVSVDDALP